MSCGSTLGCSVAGYSIHTFVMPGLVPGIHVFLDAERKEDVDGRDKPGHNDGARREIACCIRVREEQNLE